MRDNVVERWQAVVAFGIAFANLALLWLLIGGEGASRAYSVGLHTLFRDHLPAVGASLLATLLLAGVLGLSLRSIGGLWLTIWIALATDIAAAIGITLIFDEIRRHPDLLRAVLTETAGGLQLVAISAGAALGYAARRASTYRR